MRWIDEIVNFLEDYSGIHPESPYTDIFKDLGLVGDDFHEMIDNYAKEYQVDMADYLWYFHANEEGHSISGYFFKPPYERVERIPVTPQMLANFIVTKKWKVEYPKHEIPKHRIDILINQAIMLVCILGLVIWLVYRTTK
jgi:hypothetical protein